MTTKSADLLTPDLVFLDFEAKDRHDLFRRLSVELERKGFVRPSWREAIEEREEKYATGLHFDHVDVAIPHVDPEYLLKPYIAVIKLSHPVMFEHMAAAGSDVSARLVVNLGIERNGGQVAILQQLMNIFMDAKKSHSVMSQTTREGMVHVLMSYFD